MGLIYQKKHMACLYLTLMRLVANLANTKRCRKPEKWLKPWQMGTHLRELRESYPMNTKVTKFRCCSNIVASLCLRWKKPQHWKGWNISARRKKTMQCLVFFQGTLWLHACSVVDLIPGHQWQRTSASHAEGSEKVAIRARIRLLQLEYAAEAPPSHITP